MARAPTDTEQKKKFITRFAKLTLPPDLDGMNHDCAAFAEKAISEYRNGQGMSRDEALLSLLVGLRHLCDLDTRYGDFDEKAVMADEVYEDNTRASNDRYFS